MRQKNKYRAALTGICAVILATVLHAGLVTTGTTAGTGTVTKKPVHTQEIDPTLAAQLATVEQLPTMAATTIPRFAGTYYSAQCPFWPPLPGNILGLPVWNLGDNCYLVDDLAVNYDAMTMATTMSDGAQLMGGSKPMFDLSSGIPYLTVAPAGTNQLLITVINNTGPVNYELWWTPSLANPASPWTLATNGTTGQTNFIVNIGSYPYPTGFYRAIWDTNSVPAWEAADPNNPGLGILAVFIDSPANGAVLQ